MKEEKLNYYKKWIEENEEIVVDSSIFKELVDEIERLNNIINGMEKFFKYEFDNEVRPLNDRKISVWSICLDKLKELKNKEMI